MRRVLFSSGLLVAEAVARKTSLGRHESSLVSSRHHGKGSDSGLLHLRSSLVGGGRYDSGIFSSQVKSTTSDGDNGEENKKTYKTKGEEKKGKKGQEGKSGESGEAPPKKRRRVRRKKSSNKAEDEGEEQTGSKKLKSSLFEARLSGNKDSGDETTGEPQPAKKPVTRSEDTSKKSRSSSGLAGESKKTEGTKEDESPDTSKEETGTKGESPARTKRSGVKSNVKDSAESELVESDGDHSSDIGEPIRD